MVTRHKTERQHDDASPASCHEDIGWFFSPSLVFNSRSLPYKTKPSLLVSR